MNDDNLKHKVINLLFWTFIFCSIIFIIIFLILPAPTQIYIVQKHAIIENNTIVFLIEGVDPYSPDNTIGDTQFYTTTQTIYNQLQLGFCEVTIWNNKIIIFNHKKCNFLDI